VGALPDSTPDAFLDDIDVLGFGEAEEISFGGPRHGYGHRYNRIGAHSDGELKFDAQNEFQTDFGETEAGIEAGGRDLTVQQRKANLSAALHGN